MQTNLETLSSLERRLTMAVPAQSIQREVEDRLKKLSRTVRMHGFRPGRVPLKIVAQQYGPQVRSEVIGDAVQKAFDNAVKEQNLRVAGYPRIEAGEADAGGETLSFSATFEVLPEIRLGDIASATIERPTVAVGEAEIDRTIAILRKQRTQFEPAGRAAGAGDRVTIDFTGSIDDVEFPGGRASDAALILGDGRMLPDFERNLSGMAPGQSLEFPVAFPADYGNRELAGKSASFAVTMKTVEAPRLPEIDAEFARSLGVADGDLARMREEIRANVEREVKKRVDADVRNKALQALLDTTPVEVPKSLVEIEVQNAIRAARSDLERQGVRMEDMPINPEMFEAPARRRVALGLIVGELVKSKAIAATAAQVRALVEEHAQSYEQPAEMVRWIYAEPRRLKEFEGMALEAAVVQWLLANARVLDKAVGFDELMGKAT